MSSRRREDNDKEGDRSEEEDNDEEGYGSDDRLEFDPDKDGGSDTSSR